MIYSFFNILNYLAVFQIITLIIIIRMKSNWEKTENKVFLIFLFFNALLIIISVLKQTVPFDSILFQVLFFTSTSIFLLIGPLFYLFFQRILTHRESTKFSQVTHLLPILAFIILFIFLFLKKEINNQEANKTIFSGLNLLLLAISVYTQLLIYIIFSCRLLFKYVKGLASYTTTMNGKAIYWLGLLLTIYFCHWLFDALSFFLSWFDLVSSDNVTVLSSIAIFLLLGFITLTVIRGIQGFGVVQEVKQLMKYTASNLSQEQKKAIQLKLKHIFSDEKAFLNPELTIFSLAKLIDTPQKQLSQVINETFQTNFFDYINKQRIECAKSLIEKEINNDNQFTIQQIFYDSGFNTKSTFNRAFKKHTGQTPSEFREELKSK